MSLFDIVERAFAPFADPATELKLLQDGDSIVYHFTRNGNEQRGRVSRRADESLRVTPTGGAALSLNAFLASERMADLDRLARVQMALYDRKLPTSEWIAGPALVGSETASDCLQAINACTGGVSEKTTVVILDAPAGMGKTSLVERMAHEHARDFANRRRTNLTLIISSRGRRLSRLNDAIAATLQDLRAGLFYQEVPVLVRHGLLNLVIDGFDELVNQDGYGDAWSSLGDLIDSVAGSGVLILSSRDTFFSEQQFVQRAHRGDAILASRLEFRFLRLTPWSRVHIKRFFDAVGVPDSRTDRVLGSFDDSSAYILGRPFFAHYIAKKLKEGDDLDLDQLLPLIVEGFVDREANLLFGENVSVEQKKLLKRFFAELAIEMRAHERDWLEMDVIQFFLDAVLQEGNIPGELRQPLVHRAGAVAFLEQDSDGRSGRRGFPHQMFRDAFFAQAVLSLLHTRSSQIESVLKLGVYGLDLADVIVAFAEYGQAPQRSDVQWLFRLAAELPAVDSTAMNAASMGLALCRVTSLQGTEPLELSGLYLGHVSLANCEVPTLRMRDCSFGLLDLVDSVAAELDVDETVAILQVRISNITVLGRRWRCYPQALEFLDHDGERSTEWIPENIQKLIDGVRKDDGDDVKLAMTEGEALLDRLARRWVRRFYFHEADTNAEPAFSNPLWPGLKIILDKYQRLERKTTQTSGRRRELLHLRDPRHIVARKHADPVVDAEIKALWQEAIALPSAQVS